MAQQKHHLQVETLGTGGPAHRKQVCSDFKAELSGLQFCLAIWVEGDSFAVALRWGESEGKINERGMKEI